MINHLEKNILKYLGFALIRLTDCYSAFALWIESVEKEDIEKLSLQIKIGMAAAQDAEIYYRTAQTLLKDISNYDKNREVRTQEQNEIEEKIKKLSVLYFSKEEQLKISFKKIIERYGKKIEALSKTVKITSVNNAFPSFPSSPEMIDISV